MIELRVARGPSGDELKALGKRLRNAGEQGKGLRRELLRGIRDGAKPLVPQAKAAVKGTPSNPYRRSKSQAGRGSLRAEIAKTVRLQVKLTGRNPNVRIKADGAKMPAGRKSLPAYVEGAKKKWRHPVHGQDRWVVQESHEWFEPVMRAGRPRVERAAQAAAAKVAKQIEGSN